MAESEPDLEAAHVLGWYHWLRACALSDDERREATRLAVGWLWPIAVNEPTLVPGGALGLLAPSLREAALDLREEGLRTGSLVHIRHAATLLRHVLAEVPPDDPYRGLYLSNLAMTLHGVLDRKPDPETLDLLLDTARAAVDVCPGDHPHRNTALNELGLALQKKLLFTDDRGLLDEAVRVSRAAVAIARNDADRVTSLSNLAGVLKISFGIDPTADTAAELLQVSREAAHSVNNPMYLANLSGALTLVSSWNGDKALLPEAVDAAFAAVDATPQDHPSRERRTSVLADTLTGLLEQEAEPDPRRRVLLVRRALSIFPEGTPLYSALLADLSLGLQAVYLRYGERSALLEAIEVSRRAYAEPDHDDENWRGSLVTLTWALGTEFASTGDVSVLREAIEIGREACLVNNSGGTNSVLARCNLSDALLTMYQQTGETELLHEAIDRAREGSAMPPPDGERASGPHSALSAALLIHFQRTGDDQSLQEAIESGRRAVELVEGQEKVALLSNLGIVLHTAYEHRSDTTMLREAVSVCRSAVELAAPEHPNYANYLTNLGGSLGELASLENDEAGLIEALKLCRAASAVAPASHANHFAT